MMFIRPILPDPNLGAKGLTKQALTVVRVFRHYGIGHDLLRFDGANEIPPSSSFSYKSWIASVVPGTLASQEDAPR